MSQHLLSRLLYPTGTDRALGLVVTVVAGAIAVAAVLGELLLLQLLHHILVLALDDGAVPMIKTRLSGATKPKVTSSPLLRSIS